MCRGLHIRCGRTSSSIAIGDLIFTEVLRGFDGDREFATVRKLLSSLTAIEIGGLDIAIPAAENYRALRRRGITVRKTVNTLVVTRCIRERIRSAAQRHGL